MEAGVNGKIGKKVKLLLYGAALCLLVQALGYSFKAIGDIVEGLNPEMGYWHDRLLLNLLLVNGCFYLLSILTFIGARFVEVYPRVCVYFLWTCFLMCLFTIAAILALTPRDWSHTLLSLAAILLYLIAFHYYRYQR